MEANESLEVEFYNVLSILNDCSPATFRQFRGAASIAGDDTRPGVHAKLLSDAVEEGYAVEDEYGRFSVTASGLALLDRIERQKTPVAVPILTLQAASFAKLVWQRTALFPSHENRSPTTGGIVLTFGGEVLTSLVTFSWGTDRGKIAT